jgi:hypothetical protein
MSLESPLPLVEQELHTLLDLSSSPFFYHCSTTLHSFESPWSLVEQKLHTLLDLSSSPFFYHCSTTLHSFESPWPLVEQELHTLLEHLSSSPFSYHCSTTLHSWVSIATSGTRTTYLFLFFLIIVLFVWRIMASDYPFGMFKLFLPFYRVYGGYQ